VKQNQTTPSALDRCDTAFLKDKAVLVTGGTGSFGQLCVRTLLETPARKVIVFSRDELKQSEMQSKIPDPKGRLRFFIGDVRDKNRLSRAFSGVDYVIHAAALKQVPALEYNPFEAVLTNIIGSQNVIEAAIDGGVKKVVALSTDKAANPINLYGATKLCAEKLFVDGNAYSGGLSTRFSVVRYGNVVGSRGSVIPVFLAQRDSGVLSITDKRMTRFWITLEQGVRFVLNSLASMRGGEIFVPKIPSMRVLDLARAIAPKCKLKAVGIRPGEKVHEVLLTEEEAPRSLDQGSFFVIQPAVGWWENGKWSGSPVSRSFRYASDTNKRWLTGDALRKIISPA